MSDLFEAADTFRLAQIQKLKSDLAQERARVAYLIDSQAIVEQSCNGPRFWLAFPSGESQIEIYPTALEALDAMIELERGNG